MTQENELDINNQEKNKGKLTHFNEAGEAHMVDVHAKDDTYRVAKACGTIKVNGAVYKAVSTGTAKKGDVLAVARIAGIMGAKNNSMLIPLCHAIAMTKCDVEFELDEKNSSITAICTTACVGKTGVEMEAMTGVSVALLTIYDMCKALDRGMEIGQIHLLEKSGEVTARTFGLCRIINDIDGIGTPFIRLIMIVHNARVRFILQIIHRIVFRPDSVGI